MLEQNPDIDWVYGALERVHAENGELVETSTFHAPTGQDRPFLSLQAREAGKAHVLDDRRVISTAILWGLNCSQQTSLIRRDLLKKVRFSGQYRNCEDQQFPVRALLAGARLAYIDDIHLTYFVHDENISNVTESVNRQAGGEVSASRLAKMVRVQEQLVQLFEELDGCDAISVDERRTLKHRLSREYFWTLGYGIYWRHRQFDSAFKCFRQGIRHRPLHLPYWKTYCTSLLKYPFLRSSHT